MSVGISHAVSRYYSGSYHSADDMYKPPPGYQVANNVSQDLGRIAQEILSRAVNERWKMPSDMPISFDGKKYIARYQIHGPNSINPKNHPGIGLYEQIGNQQYKSTVGSKLDDEFFVRLNEMSNRLNVSPKDMLAIMYLESGLDPNVVNPKFSARGLTQIEPYVLKNLGWKGSYNEFGKLPAIEQLPYIEKYFKNVMGNSGKIHSATQLYVANFWPAALHNPDVMKGDPSAIILDGAKYPKEYDANKGLDVDKDGKITYGDLMRMVNGKKKSLNQNNVYARFDNAVSSGYKPQQKEQSITNMIATFLSGLGKMLDNLTAGSNSKFNKYGDKYPLNTYIISISNCDLPSKLEFARILSIAIKEEIDAESNIYTNGKDVELQCHLNANRSQGLEVVKEFCVAVSGAFKVATKSIGGIKIYTSVSTNEYPHYQILDIKLADMNYRKFQLKFAKRPNDKE
jgi:hypothetical protein